MTNRFSVVETTSATLDSDSPLVVESMSEIPTEVTDAPTAGRWGLLSPRSVGLAVVVVVLLWSYAPNLRSLMSTWNDDPNYSHGFLVLPVALVILWRHWVESEPITL